MQNALLILSPLDPALLDSHSGARAAQALKHIGAHRADLSTDPRFGYTAPDLVHKNRAAPAFTAAARALIDYIFRPMLGHSEICDLSYAPQSVISPDLQTLANVGAIFAHNSTILGSRGMDEHDGRDLGLIFYLAIHARASDRKRYDLLAYPGISARAHTSLFDRMGDIAGPALGAYGPTINLTRLRTSMTALAATGQPAPKYLH